MRKCKTEDDPTVAVLLEQERFSEENPERDRGFLVDEAIASLERGVPIFTVQSIYGAEVARRAVFQRASRVALDRA